MNDSNQSLIKSLENPEYLMAGAAALPFLSAGLGGVLYGMGSDLHSKEKAERK